jgi:hypothetical protein
MRTDACEPVRLTNDELLTHVKELVRRDRAALVELLIHLGEVDAREAYLADGAPSLFTWCTRVLHLGEAAAFTRIRAARVARRFPVILDRLAQGAVHVHAVARLAPHLTAENHAVLLEEATRAPRPVIDAIVARFREPGPISTRVVPQVAGRPHRAAGRRSSARRLSPAVGRSRTAPASDCATVGNLFDPVPADEGNPSRQSSTPLESETPHTPLNWRLHVTLSPAAHEDLERLRELMRHQVPDGDPSVILARALALLRQQVEGRRLGRGRTPRSPRAATTNGAKGVVESGRSGAQRQHVPASVRRQVSRRDQDRCAFVTADGRRCAERAWLEFHHVVPRAIGGRVTIGNIELRCRAHNRYEAERDFDGFVRESGSTYSSARASPASPYGNPSG